MNISFENDHAKVPRYRATYQILSNGGLTLMFYYQIIDVVLQIPGLGPVPFPHITTNLLTKVS